MGETDNFIDDLECEIAGLQDEVTDLRAKLEAAEAEPVEIVLSTETADGGANERVYALLNAEGLLPYMARISDFTPEEVEAGMLADADAQAERDNHAFVQRLIKAADQPKPAYAEGIASEGGSAKAANPRDRVADAPSAEAARTSRIIAKVRRSDLAWTADGALWQWDDARQLWVEQPAPFAAAPTLGIPGVEVAELLAARGERHCDNPLCTRIGARCVGWHCPHCGGATSSQGHERCRAQRA